jgi:iron complex transport system ATP-binding protein
MLKSGKIFRDGKPEEIIRPAVLKELYDTELIVIKNPVSGKPNLVYPGFE